jgi:hypothetical protein
VARESSAVSERRRAGEYNVMITRVIRALSIVATSVEVVANGAAPSCPALLDPCKDREPPSLPPVLGVFGKSDPWLHTVTGTRLAV